MSVVPEKNGCNVWLEEYGCYIHGDSYHMPNGDLIIRTHPQKMYEPQGGKEHYNVPHITHWFDEHQQFGTLVVSGQWEYFGYQGRSALPRTMAG
jgi:hypothetical protein